MGIDDGRGRGPAALALSIPTQAFDLLRSLVEARTGFHASADRSTLLADRLADLVARHGLRSYLDLYYRLRYDEDQERLWAEVRDHLAVPETYFWRQPEQLLALGQLVHELLEIRRNGRVRLWSAACCSGEEPLSMAMALESGGVPLERVEIVASDASPRLLERARRGVYSDRSVSRLPAELRARYLTREAQGWRVAPRLHARVEWRLANLVEPAEVRPLARADVIFCRNVFIYFADETVAKIVETFTDAMPDGAVLFVGAAESLLRLGAPLTLEEAHGAFLYRKGPARDRVRSGLPVPRAPSLR